MLFQFIYDELTQPHPVRTFSNKNLIKDKSVTHIEFILESWTSIKRVLKIHHISELGTAEEIFTTLEKRYLPEKEIHREKFRKTLIKYNANPDKARYRSEMLCDIQNLKDWIDRSKSHVLHKKQVQPLYRRINKKIMIMNRWDKFIMDVDYKYFLKNKKLDKILTDD